VLNLQAARAAFLIGAIATGWFFASPSVSRASVELSVGKTDVAGSDELLVRAVGSATNVVFVRYQDPGYVITSAGSPLATGPGCLVVDLDVAVCVGQIGSARVLGGDGTDVIDFTGVPIPVDGDGGPGDDALTGGAAASTLDGGDGVDQLTGGSQRDDLDGGSGDDWLRGLAGSDALMGAAGDDILEGGNGTGDLLAGGAGRDLLEGGDGADILDGDSGADALFGGAGADKITPGRGADTLIKLRTTDQLNCLAEVVDNEIRPTSCAEIKSGAPPEAWPPKETAAADAASSKAFAVPVVPGRATAVVVHMPAKQSKPVRRCLRTYKDRDRTVALHPYRIKFRSRFWPTVAEPPPNPMARAARLTGAKHCR
jgi:RTX calcium-binding nonapeptide repeat (4 copies)